MPVIETITSDSGSEVCAIVSSFSPFALARPRAPWTWTRLSSCAARPTAPGTPTTLHRLHGGGRGVGPGRPGRRGLLALDLGSARHGGRQRPPDRDRCATSPGNCATAGPIVGNKMDRKAPALTLPADRTVDATSPAGATVSYSATATDGADPSPTVSCSPASGATFAVGTTTIACTATDHVGNVSSGSFHVTVLGAKEQLSRLIQKVVDARRSRRRQDAAYRQAAGAHRRLRPGQAGAAAGSLLRAQAVHRRGATPFRARYPTAQATEWIADANRIRTALAC